MLVFDGFPYLVTRIVAGLHHLTVLPSELDDGGLVEVGPPRTMPSSSGASNVPG